MKTINKGKPKDEDGTMGYKKLEKSNNKWIMTSKISKSIYI